MNERTTSLLKRLLRGFESGRMSLPLAAKRLRGLLKELPSTERDEVVQHLIAVYSSHAPSKTEKTPHPLIVHGVLSTTGLSHLASLLRPLPDWDTQSTVNDLKELVLQPIFSAFHENRRTLVVNETVDPRPEIQKIRAHDHREELATLVGNIDCIEDEQLFGRYEALSDGEIERDRYDLREALRRLGFSDGLVSALDELEHAEQIAGSAFDFARSIGTCRSFLETLHKEAAHMCDGRALKWGPATSLLKTKGILPPSIEKYVAALYGAMSDRGVHALTAKAEYVRIFKNTVIEYSLLFLRLFEHHRRSS